MSLILRDIFGLEPKPASTSDDESSSECVVCMSAPRDTLVLPCRHLCLCKGCAEVLRFQVRAQVYDASPCCLLCATLLFLKTAPGLA